MKRGCIGLVLELILFLGAYTRRAPIEWAQGIIVRRLVTLPKDGLGVSGNGSLDGIIDIYRQAFVTRQTLTGHTPRE